MPKNPKVKGGKLRKENPAAEKFDASDLYPTIDSNLSDK
jgi:hypothetical protein